MCVQSPSLPQGLQKALCMEVLQRPSQPLRASWSPFCIGLHKSPTSIKGLCKVFMKSLGILRGLKCVYLYMYVYTKGPKVTRDFVKPLKTLRFFMDHLKTPRVFVKHPHFCEKRPPSVYVCMYKSPQTQRGSMMSSLYGGFTYPLKACRGYIKSLYIGCFIAPHICRKNTEMCVCMFVWSLLKLKKFHKAPIEKGFVIS